MFSLVAMAVGTDEPDPNAQRARPRLAGWTPRRNFKKKTREDAKKLTTLSRQFEGREGG